MSDQRYVVIGLAHARSRWFADVARWATAGSIPVEFVKCLSAEELRARLAAGRPFSAALLDGRLTSVDRDLLSTVADANIAGIVVGAIHRSRDWRELGAAAHLPEEFDRPALVDALATHGRLINTVRQLPADEHPDSPDVSWHAPLVSVIGRSGSGASTVCAALAQRLAGDPRYAGGVLLVDLVRQAHQAVLHDARDVVPGVQEIIEMYRSASPSAADVGRLSFDVPNRRYRIVLGLRHPRDWVTIRARAFDTALTGMRRASRIVVADTDPDLEGEAESGSLDIEDRHLLGRHTAEAADLVVVVATPSVTGLHGLVRQLDALRQLGVDGSRLLVVINRSPRSPRARAELSRVVGTLTRVAERPDPHLGPVFLPERRGMDGIHRDLARFPTAFADPIGRAVIESLERLPDSLTGTASEPEPVLVAPGSLGLAEETDS